MQQNGQVTIQTDDMELAGNVVQSLGKFLSIEDLQTSGDFPQELDQLQKVFSQVEFLLDFLIRFIVRSFVRFRSKNINQLDNEFLQIWPNMQQWFEVF